MQLLIKESSKLNTTSCASHVHGVILIKLYLRYMEHVLYMIAYIYKVNYTKKLSHCARETTNQLILIVVQLLTKGIHMQSK